MFLTHRFLLKVINAAVTSVVAISFILCAQEYKKKYDMLFRLHCNINGEALSFSYVWINESTNVDKFVTSFDIDTAVANRILLNSVYMPSYSS